jgi:hypothetical protein
VHQQAFDNVKAAIAKEVTLAYPDPEYSQEFESYNDGSKKQLGAVITQKNRLIAFFSRKLSEAQQRYSVTKIELLVIVEALKEYRGMLWGQKIKVYTLMRDALGLNSVDSVKVLCKDGKRVIPKNLQNRAVALYHHYLQHPAGLGCAAPSAPTSKSATNARSTSTVNTSTINYLQSLLKQNPGTLDVLISLVHTLSRVKTVL